METRRVKYNSLHAQLEALLSKDGLNMSKVANFVALIKQTFSSFSWVGFYIYKNDGLHLSHFQGKVACTYIEVGKGVCGTVFASKKPLIVPNVNEFEGHIVCDEGSQSEIVLPVIIKGEIIGVFDIDSYELNNFSEVDLDGLDKALQILINSLNLKEELK